MESMMGRAPELLAANAKLAKPRDLNAPPLPPEEPAKHEEVPPPVPGQMAEEKLAEAKSEVGPENAAVEAKPPELPPPLPSSGPSEPALVASLQMLPDEDIDELGRRYLNKVAGKWGRDKKIEALAKRRHPKMVAELVPAPIPPKTD